MSPYTFPPYETGRDRRLSSEKQTEQIVIKDLRMLVFYEAKQAFPQERSQQFFPGACSAGGRADSHPERQGAWQLKPVFQKERSPPP